MPDENLDGVLEFVSRLAQKCAGGNFIYRGEPECYPKVSSGLYREYPEIESAGFDIELLQNQILYEAKRYSEPSSLSNAGEEFAILVQLQHYGGKTNLIDFTTDCLVALFFACEEAHDENGRVVMLNKAGSLASRIYSPPSSLTLRVPAQKSIFVRPPRGYVEPDDQVIVPSDLKLPILDYLHTCHGISNPTVYSDFHGFIRQQQTHKGAYEIYLSGLISQHSQDFSRAIACYSDAIRRYPQFTLAYTGRGDAYVEIGELDKAILDYSVALSLDTELIDIYINRGFVHCENGGYESAIQDFRTAREMDPENVDAWHGLGIALGAIGEHQAAIQNLSDALMIEPRAEIYRNLGVIYGNSGNLQLAVEHYDRVLELLPDDEFCYYDRAEVHLRLGHWDSARSDLSSAIELGANLVDLFHHDYGNVSEFEDRNNIQLPDDIAELLGG